MNKNYFPYSLTWAGVLPSGWGWFIPVWMWFPVSLGITKVIASFGLPVGLTVVGVYLASTLASIIPIVRNRMSGLIAFAWVMGGSAVTAVFAGVLGVVGWIALDRLSTG